MICAGIDAGSRTTKVVLLDGEKHEPIAFGVVDQGVEQEKVAEELLKKLLRKSGVKRRQLDMVVATGYGRKLIHSADVAITEISCQAWGVRHYVPAARTIIDIGGQDSKLLRLHDDGTVADFVMNDRCAAGTGRFLELLAARLGVRLAKLGELAERSRCPAVISNMCVVFAESEIIGLLASGVSPENIAAGAQQSLASRAAAMSGKKLDEPIVFTGGAALACGMENAISEALGLPVIVPPRPQLTCALGAAVLGHRRMSGQKTPAL